MAKRSLCQTERTMTVSGVEVHKRIFKAQRIQFNHMMQSANASFHCGRIQSCSNQRELFTIVDDLIGDKKSSAAMLSSHDSETKLTQSFSEFFVDKISKIREGFDTAPISEERTLPDSADGFSNFSLANEESLTKIITSMKSESCALDPISTNLSKSCLHDVISLLVDIVSESLSEGFVPDSFKKAVVRHLLKKIGLDPDSLNNYRPLSNSPFTSKALEPVVFSQLHEYLSNGKLYTKFQSAYHQYHSTITAPFRLHNDVMVALDNREEVI